MSIKQQKHVFKKKSVRNVSIHKSGEMCTVEMVSRKLKDRQEYVEKYLDRLKTVKNVSRHIQTLFREIKNFE